MRVLHVLDHSLPVKDGYAFRSQALLNAQQGRGWHVAAVTSPKHYESTAAAWTPHEFVGNVTFHRTPPTAGSLPIVAQMTLMRALTGRLAGVVTDERPNLLHAHSPTLNLFPATRIGR